MNHEYAHEMISASSVAMRAMRLAMFSLLACFFFFPALAQGQVRRLSFTVKTGDDDLRGGNDNLNVGIRFRDGNVQFKANVNRNRAWGENTTENFEIGLQQPVALSEIASIDFKKPTGSGLGTDEWHMQSVSIRAVGDAIDKVIATHGFMTFDVLHQDLRILVTPAVAGKANKLELTIKTGGDDLQALLIAGLVIFLWLYS